VCTIAAHKACTFGKPLAPRYSKLQFTKPTSTESNSTSAAQGCAQGFRYERFRRCSSCVWKSCLTIKQVNSGRCKNKAA
jgi:hypothetical protein